MRAHQPPASRSHKGFTLIELLSVIVVLAILAIIVIAQFNRSIDETRQAAFINDTRVFAQAADLFRAKTGQLVPDSSSGNLPGGGFDSYIDADRWVAGTPIGGSWDTETNETGVTSAVGVHFNGPDTQDATYMTAIDDAFDDGDLNSGAFREIAASRYYYVMVD